MSKILSLFLVIAILVVNTASLASCTEEKNVDNTHTEEGSPKNPEPEDNDGKEGSITVPVYKDFGRGTLDFKSITYVRPDCDEIISKIEKVTELIKSETKSFEEELSSIRALEDDYALFLTMHSYANVMNSIDSSDAYWSEEFIYLNGKYPLFSKAIEDMSVAAASSAHAMLFEKEYFGEGFVSRYKDGGIYTEKLTLLMKKENDLESLYSSLSPVNVIIDYDGKTDSYKNIIEGLEAEYEIGSSEYEAAVNVCEERYERAVLEKSVDIMVELFEVRREISDELGYSSYSELAYRELGHEYSEQELLILIGEVKNYIIPLYNYLEYFVFLQFFSENDFSVSSGKNNIINNTYEHICESNSEFSEIYEYMLQHGLFSVENESEKRFSGSFTTYLESYEAPFLFVTLQGDADDYFTFSHEFGHFLDGFLNYGDSASLELSEVSSTAFEWLMLDGIDTTFSKKDAIYLKYLKFRSTLEAIISQSFYALFEHYAYSLDSERISESSLRVALVKAAKDLGLNHAKINSLEYAVIPHIMLYPFYVQSYVVSEITSLGIYFMEETCDGDGWTAYKDLINRDEEFIGFEEQLSDAGIRSPFERGFVRDIADAIHYELIGAHLGKRE